MFDALELVVVLVEIQMLAVLFVVSDTAVVHAGRVCVGWIQHVLVATVWIARSSTAGVDERGSVRAFDEVASRTDAG